MPIPQPDEASVSWIRFIFASATVLGLMAALGWALNYFSMRGWIKTKHPARQLAITASLPLDARRRLVIAKCNDIEYHLLLGPHADLLLSQRPAPACDCLPDPSSPDTSSSGSPL